MTIRKRLSNFKDTLFVRLSPINRARTRYYKRFYSFAEKSPLKAFGILLFVLLLLIVLSNFISSPKTTEETASTPVKEVSVYSIGTSPRIEVQAVVEKSGVIKIVALGPGVVQQINVFVGQEVFRGTNLVSMSTNYQGGNIFSVQRQIAQAQYKNVLNTFQTQKDLIQKQKELAIKTDENSDELREISRQSIDSTRGLINLNNEILSALETQQAELESTNVGGVNDAAILQTKQLRSQLLAGNNQLQAALRSTEFSSSDTEAPAQLSDLGRDIALKQLEIQEKALGLNKEVSRLSLVVAQINESLMFPSSPVKGVVERIYVKVGQSITPGTPIAQISGHHKSLIAVALLSREMANSISRAELSTLHLGEQTLDIAPFYVSVEATEGSLYSAQFSIPEEYNSEVTDKGYITIDIPIGSPKTSGIVPFVPLDSVFQTQDEAFLFVVKNGKAETRRIRLGEVMGRFVEVKEGLKSGDQVILNRNIIAGDKVKVISK